MFVLNDRLKVIEGLGMSYLQYTPRWTSVLSKGKVTILLVTSCFRNWDKLQHDREPDGPLSLHADLTIFLPLLVYEGCFSMRFYTDRKTLTWPEGVKKLLTTVIICVSRMGKSFGLSSTPTNSLTVLRICTD